VRELVNRVQNLRKDNGFEVTDHILLELEAGEKLHQAIEAFSEYISSETLGKLIFVEQLEGDNVSENGLIDEITLKIRISRQS